MSPSSTSTLRYLCATRRLELVRSLSASKQAGQCNCVEYYAAEREMASVDEAVKELEEGVAT